MPRAPTRLLLHGLLTLSLALLCGAAAAVAASTRGDTEYGMKGGGITRVTYFADAGEANRLEVGLEDGRIVFEDAGADIRPGAQCSGDGRRVTCQPAQGARFGLLTVDLSNADDELTVLGSITGMYGTGGFGADVLRVAGSAGVFTGELSGEEGDDRLSSMRGGTLSGGVGRDSIQGGAAPATLDGGPGADVLAGGRGDETLAPGTDGDADVVDGAAGYDTVSYADSERPYRPVAIDLAARAAAPGDELRSIEGATGSYADDVLRGTDRGDRLHGSMGDDKIRGGAGADVLEGGPGADDIAGGPGDDRVSGATGRDTLSAGAGDDWVDPWSFEQEDHRSVVSCGGGTDVLFLPDPLRDVAAAFRSVPPDCELLDLDYSMLGRLRARPVIAGSTARWSLLCKHATWKGRCPTTFELHSGSAPLGRGSARPRRGERANLIVALNEAGRRLARRGGRIDVTMRMKSYYGGFTIGDPRRFAVALPGP